MKSRLLSRFVVITLIAIQVSSCFIYVEPRAKIEGRNGTIEEISDPASAATFGLKRLKTSSFRLRFKFATFAPADAVVQSRLHDWFTRPFYSSKVRVVSLVEETQVARNYERLLPSSNRVRVAFTDLTSDVVLHTVEHSDGDMVIIIGHVEDKDFVCERLHSFENVHIPIADLQAAAGRSKTTLVLVGCRTANSGASGFHVDLEAAEAVQRVAKAINSSTYGDFISEMGGSGDDFAISPELEKGAMRQYTVVSSRSEAFVPGAATLFLIVAEPKVADHGEPGGDALVAFAIVIVSGAAISTAGLVVRAQEKKGNARSI